MLLRIPIGLLEANGDPHTSVLHRSEESAAAEHVGHNKMKLGVFSALYLVHLLSSIQMSHQEVVLDMMPDTFDDQYIGCADKMEAAMPKILEEEMNDDQFAAMWNISGQEWNRTRFNVSKDFKDEYGIALLLYTMESPYLIYKQLNGNISIAGQSRDYYMDHFHLKALHFYLTRALQVLRRGCGNLTQVYRGTRIGSVNVTNEMRFDGFVSSYSSMGKAAGFGLQPYFFISTCYGVDISELLLNGESEFLIPIGETFTKVSQSGTAYKVESTGKLCSFYNCAYFKDKKRSRPVCNSARGGSLEIQQLLTRLTVTLALLLISFL
ncbi:erythroblast NAD(P)(+)--arginine ADP-ribosyltransferase-like [Hyperolius riggenbachi]|uniref:erythroblast NAD(P)(+)--arginine ADP-ribosyltransferase-like n=1 Tax=Hyperolius riggenbachi TaxID=752182 RepID=UPI0035A2DD54